MGFSLKRPKRAKAVIFGIVLAVSAGTTGYYLFTDTSAVAAPETAEVERGEVALTASATGIVAPDRQWSLGFEGDAEVTEVNVAAGDEVAAGDVLGRADDTEAAEIVEQAEEALAEAEDELEEAEDDGASCEAATEATAGIDGGPPVNECQGTGADAVLSAQQLVNQAEADLAAAEAALEATVITAPADATVLSVSASEGTTLAAGTTLIELGDLSSVAVEADFAEADAAALEAGQTVTVSFSDSDDEIEAEIGTVDLVGTAAEDLVTYGVAIDIADPPDSIRSGSTATVSVVLTSVGDALYVPVSALASTDGDTAEVTVIDSDGTESVRAVTTGLYGDAGVEVVSGLAEGEIVLVDQ